MERREKQLLSNDAPLASNYMDPRFLPILSKAKHAVDVSHLEKIHKKLQDLNRTYEVQRTFALDVHRERTSMEISDDGTASGEASYLS